MTRKVKYVKYLVYSAKSNSEYLLNEPLLKNPEYIQIYFFPHWTLVTGVWKGFCTKLLQIFGGIYL